jgi:hypothetical protein
MRRHFSNTLILPSELLKSLLSDRDDILMIRVRANIIVVYECSIVQLLIGSISIKSAALYRVVGARR